MALTQEHRRLAISSPLGEDVLLFRRMAVSEHLGQLFSCDIEVLSEDHDIKLEDLVGQNVSIRYEMPEAGETRYFNGFVSQFRYAGVTGNLALYQAQLRPWLWFLTRTSDSRIFQEKTVPDIIKEIFRDYGFTDFEDRLSETYRTWEYCVQHRETDFNFVCRLMEQEGIYFYFLHEADKHTLVLADSISGHDPCPGYERVPYYPAETSDVREEDHISDWSVYQEAQPGAYTLRAFDFKVPKKNLEARQNQPLEHAQADFEVYDYPGDYWEPGDGQTYARIRLEEIHGQFEQVQGSGNVSGFFAGGLFELDGYPRRDQNREYLIISTSIELSQDAYETDSSGGGESFCQCHFTALDNQRPYRPPRITPKPLVQGPQTAMVVGPAGQEIFTDEHSRVKVQFHWDREGNYDENSSCWIRVSQPWAGKSWGGIAIPRIGQEVIVSFLEGDPDQPMITGRVYNGDAMPPYSLPGQAVISGMKTNSTPGGGGYNEIAMDDTAGNELLRTHAQYDMDTTVEHDQRNTIVNHRSTTITEGNDTLTISTGTRTETIEGAVTQNYNTTQDTTVANHIVITSNESHVHITASTEIKLEVGASTLLMKSDGSIELTGVNIAVSGSESVSTSGMAITSEAGNDHTIKGNLVLSEGKATNTVKGGMVMLNP